jgi:peptidoglycan hydrolase CwlO-like protein
MKRKLFLVFSVLLVASTSFIGMIGPDHVEANSTMENKIKSIQEDRSKTQIELEQKDQEIKEVEQKLKLLEDEVRILDHQTADTNQQIRSKDNEIAATKERVASLKEEIRILEERIAERDELLKNRVRSMYKNGGSVDYVEVILGAQNFGDLINRLTALNTIAQQDRNILEAHHNDKIMVEEAKLMMEQELIGLEEQLGTLEVLKATLESQRQEKDRLMAQLDEQEIALHAEAGVLSEAGDILAAQEIAMKAELQAWQERQKQLAEQKRQQEAAAAKAAKNGTQYSAPAVTQEGNFMRPTTGSISSPYGPRWGRMHSGIDIGKGGRTGDVPIVAVEVGTVIRSYYSPSYGNTVMISHNVDGQVITTLSAHLENRLVTDGQRVEKGQILGYMGNTGRSFGAHLHFEVHEGPWNGAKSNAVDPLRYIPRN